MARQTWIEGALNPAGVRPAPLPSPWRDLFMKVDRRDWARAGGTDFFCKTGSRSVKESTPVFGNERGRGRPFVNAKYLGVRHACRHRSQRLDAGALEEGYDLRQDENEDAEDGNDDADPAPGSIGTTAVACTPQDREGRKGEPPPAFANTDENRLSNAPNRHSGLLPESRSPGKPLDSGLRQGDGSGSHFQGYWSAVIVSTATTAGSGK